MLIRFLLVSVLLAACGGSDDRPVDGSDFVEVPCTPDQPAPYPSGLPYVGIHANAANDDVVPCETADAYAEAWHALKGHAVMQPSTLSPEGETVYVTATTPVLDGCTMYALAAEDGTEDWCVPLPFDVVASSVEVDETGDLYVSAGGQLWSFDSAGGERWSTPLWPVDQVPTTDEERSAWTGYGVHFTTGGDIATVTASGRVVVAKHWQWCLEHAQRVVLIQKKLRQLSCGRCSSESGR